MEGANVQRKITQIAAAAADDCPPTLYALCDDSSVWVGGSNVSGEFHWHQLPDVPQDAGEQGFAKPRTGILTRSAG